MLESLIDAIKAICPDTYQVPAPPGLGRFVAWHEYAVSSLYGDDFNLLDVPALQIDVYVQDPADALPGQIAALLQSWRLPYEIPVSGLMEYDDDMARYRTIFQLEAV